MKKHEYELIILDINLPEMDGWQVLELLRRKSCPSRIMMLTAKGRDTDVAKGMALGADAYMTKPFSTKELLDKVREMLGAGA